MRVEIIPDGHAERVAYILGPSSAMAMAIKDRDARRERGEDAHIFLTSTKTLLVGPMPAG